MHGAEDRKRVSRYETLALLQVLAALRDGRTPEPEPYNCVTVIFCDIVDFGQLLSTLPPQEVGIHAHLINGTTAYRSLSHGMLVSTGQTGMQS